MARIFKDLDVKKVAENMVRNRTLFEIELRAEAEKMMGCKFEQMTQEQRVLVAEVLAAFWTEMKV